MLRAIAMPIDAPTPAVLPPPTARDAATTVEKILDRLSADKSTSVWVVMTLSAMSALTRLRTTFWATAPAPATATPAVLPKPADSAAAAETELIVLRVTENELS